MQTVVVAALFIQALAFGVQATVNLTRLGAFDYLTYESSPIVFGGKLLIMETITMYTPSWAGHWDPAFVNCSSYYRVRNLQTGDIIVNITETCNHSFGSAMVVDDPSAGETVYIFGTAWWRYEFDSEAEQHGTPPNGAMCSRTASESNCSVSVFWSSDLQTWSTNVAVTLAPGSTAFNTDVAIVKASPAGLPYHTYIMALEQPGAGWFYETVFYITNASTPTTGWTPLDPTKYRVPATDYDIGACPAIRYLDGYYYVLTSSLRLVYGVPIVRSKDLLNWELGNTSVVVSPWKIDCAVANYANFQPNATLAAYLRGCSFNTDSSDLDFIEWTPPSGSPQVIVVWIASNQLGAPPSRLTNKYHFGVPSDFDGYQGFQMIASFSGTLAQWLGDYFV